MDFSFMTTLACLSAGISVFCFSLFTAHLMQQVEVEKQETVRQLPIIFKMAMPFVGNVEVISESSLFQNNKKEAANMLMMAGYDQLIDAKQLIGVQIILVLFGLLFAIMLFILKQPLTAVILVVLLYFYPKIWLKAVVKKRHLEIQKALPNVLDLLTLSVEAGKDFLTSLRDILARRRRDALNEELERTFREIQLGKQRRVALKDLSQRVQQPDLTAVLNSIIQADELGVSIGQILKIQSDQLRGKRFNRAEKLANEAPVKILFPLVLFILPSVIIILMGPVILRGLNILFK